MPGLLLYFDVTPKLTLLFVATAAGLLLWRTAPKISKQARLLLLLFALEALSLLVSTLLSTHPGLSWNGGNWRRFGLLPQFAVLAFAFLVLCDCGGREERMRVYLKAIVAAAVPVALYAILQYFGIDPWLPAQSYRAGEDTWAIVRPPSTMGHASYLASYLLCAVFMAAALWRVERSVFWRSVAAGSAVLSCAAIFLSGTRAALLGLAVGAALLAWKLRPALRAQYAVLFAAAACVAIAFYLSAAGVSLRHRVNWIAAEPLGGVRPALWRDTLAMSEARLTAGFGPETFITEYPRFESLAVARAYPDFLHESPHNIFLDALIAQGAPGLAILAALCALGLYLSFAARDSISPLLGAALGALIAAQFFTSFVMPTALFFYILLALIAAPTITSSAGTRPSRILRAIACAGAMLFAVVGLRLLLWDQSVEAASHSIEAGNLQRATRQYRRALDWAMPGWSADLYYSRRLAAYTGATTDPRRKLQAWRESLASGARAALTSDEKQNAYYNLAALLSVENNASNVERSLREAIRASPHWYKPHWALARVLMLEGKLSESRREAELAASCNGRAPEILKTLETVRAAQRP